MDAGAIGIEADGAAPGEILYGDDVPAVAGREEGDHEVHFVGGVIEGLALHISGNDDLISVVVFALGRAEGGLDLDAQQTRFVLDEAVVVVAVAPGFGDADAFAGGAIHESQFGEFSSELAVLKNIKAVFCHGFGPL